MTTGSVPSVFARITVRTLAVALVFASILASARLCGKADDQSRTLGIQAVCAALQGDHALADSLARQALRRHPGAHASLTWRAVEALASGHPALHHALTERSHDVSLPQVEGFTPQGLRWLRSQLVTTGPDCSPSPPPMNR